MYKRGQSLVELLIAIGLLSIFLPALITSLASSREGKAQENQRLQAATLLKEANEAVRSIREKGWTTFAVSGTYHPVISGSSWSLAPGSESINGFTRQTVISDIYRDSNGNIVSIGGTNDPSTKKIVNTVSWNTPFTSSVSSTFYLTRYLNNAVFFQSTETEFLAGTTSNTTVANNSGGEVLLGSGGHGEWCKPNLSITALDLPKQGVANAISAVEGHISAGTGENASGVSYAKISIDNSNPPVAALAGTFDGYKTNDVFTDGSYTYIATDNHSKEVVILDISGTPTETGYFNIPGNTHGDAIYVSGNKGYVTSGWLLYIFDLSQKSGSRPQVGLPFIILGNGTSVVVKDNYAYVSVSSSPLEMQIIDISNPWNLFQIGYADVNGTDGKRVFINDSATRAYLVTNASDSLPEFFIIDISNKTGSRPVLGSYDASGMNPKSLAVIPGSKAIIVGTGGQEYQVLDISDEANPKLCGGLNIDSGINGVSAVLESDGDAYAYIITGDANAELKIIEGGPGGRFASSGTYESQIMGYPSSSSPTQISLNRFSANISKSDLNNLKIQVGASDAVNGNCSGVNLTYVGPDGSTGSFFNPSSNSLIEGTIPVGVFGAYKNPGYCYGYKAYFSTTDITSSPVLYDISTNYSP